MLTDAIVGVWHYPDGERRRGRCVDDKNPAVEPTEPAASAEALTGWSDTLARFDEVREALELVVLEDESDGKRLKQTLLLIQSGRPTEALQVLDGGVPRDLPSEGYGFEDLLRATCWAANGHDGAYGWLRSRVWAAPSGEFEFGQWLLAMVADGRGDYVTADQMWKAIVPTGAYRTWQTVSHYLVAMVVEARHNLLHGSTVVAEGGSILRLAQLPESLPNHLDRDPRPILRARDMLLARGEREAAMLLLTAARYGARPSKAIKAAYRDLAPKTPWLRWYWVVLFAVIGAGVATLLHVPQLGIPAAAVIMYGWRRFIPIRGYSLEESRVLRLLSRMTFNPKSRGPRARGILQMDATPFIYGLLGATVGLGVAGYIAHQFLADHLTDNEVVWLALGGAVIGALVGWQLAEKYVRSRALHLQRRPSKITCSCATTSLMTGDLGADYAERHLVRVNAPRVIAASQQLKCPQLGIDWLLVTVTAEGALYLMRGATQTLDANLPIERGPEGFYL